MVVGVTDWWAGPQGKMTFDDNLMTIWWQCDNTWASLKMQRATPGTNSMRYCCAATHFYANMVLDIRACTYANFQILHLYFLGNLQETSKNIGLKKHPSAFLANQCQSSLFLYDLHGTVIDKPTNSPYLLLLDLVAQTWLANLPISHAARLLTCLSYSSNLPTHWVNCPWHFLSQLSIADSCWLFPIDLWISLVSSFNDGIPRNARLQRLTQGDRTLDNEQIWRHESSRACATSCLRQAISWLAELHLGWLGCLEIWDFNAVGAWLSQRRSSRLQWSSTNQRRDRGFVRSKQMKSDIDIAWHSNTWRTYHSLPLPWRK